VCRQVSSSVVIGESTGGAAPSGLLGYLFALRAEATNPALKKKADTCVRVDGADLPLNSMEKIIQSCNTHKNDFYILK
jgi:hypothetical protein